MRGRNRSAARTDRRINGDWRNINLFTYKHGSPPGLDDPSRIDQCSQNTHAMMIKAVDEIGNFFRQETAISERDPGRWPILISSMLPVA